MSRSTLAPAVMTRTEKKFFAELEISDNYIDAIEAALGSLGQEVQCDMERILKNWFDMYGHDTGVAARIIEIAIKIKCFTVAEEFCEDGLDADPTRTKIKFLLAETKSLQNQRRDALELIVQCMIDNAYFYDPNNVSNEDLYGLSEFTFQRDDQRQCFDECLSGIQSFAGFDPMKYDRRSKKIARMKSNLHAERTISDGVFLGGDEGIGETEFSLYPNSSSFNNARYRKLINRNLRLGSVQDLLQILSDFPQEIEYDHVIALDEDCYLVEVGSVYHSGRLSNLLPVGTVGEIACMRDVARVILVHHRHIGDTNLMPTEAELSLNCQYYELLESNGVNFMDQIIISEAGIFSALHGGVHGPVLSNKTLPAA